MKDDERCCGTGTCIIDAEGHCWCGQQWDGEKMCHPAHDNTPATHIMHPTLSAPDNAGDPADTP